VFQGPQEFGAVPGRVVVAIAESMDTPRPAKKAPVLDCDQIAMRNVCSCVIFPSIGRSRTAHDLAGWRFVRREFRKQPLQDVVGVVVNDRRKVKSGR